MRKTAGRKGQYAEAVPATPVVKNASLLATDVEKAATSASLYGDHKARVSANVHNIHDRLRKSAYAVALREMRGKRILHLGCGMGLLSMLAARTIGTGSVVAVDTSAIVQHADIVAKANKLDNLQFFRGSFLKKEIELPAEVKEAKFDVILCEWPSSFVTNDTALLKELLWCRDNLLKADGVVCPNQASLHVAGVTDYQYRMDTLDYWDNVYGFKMSAMKDLVAREPTAASLGANQVVTDPTLIKTVKIADMKSDADFGYAGDFALAAKDKATVHYLTFYVDATFIHPSSPSGNFVLPFKLGASNPWTEVSAMLPEPLPVNVGDAVKGRVAVQPKGDNTELTIDVAFKNSIVEHASSSKHYFQY